MNNYAIVEASSLDELIDLVNLILEDNPTWSAIGAPSFGVARSYIQAVGLVKTTSN